MIPVKLGTDSRTGIPVNITEEQIKGHTHSIGATGSGKSVLLITFLYYMMLSTAPEYSIFLIDPMGGLSQSLLNLISHPLFSTKRIRERLVYIQPSRSDVITPFNPMSGFQDQDELYYRIGRMVEVLLRSFKSQDIEQMPRLRYWLFATLYAIAEMGLPPAFSEFLLRPGTPQHEMLIRAIPDRMRMVWAEILNSHPKFRQQFLESTRNRTAPFFDNPTMQLMMSQTENRFDVERFIRENRIVIVDISENRKLDHHIASTLGGMHVNEIISNARNLPVEGRSPSILVLDEFQRFVGPDLYFALPELRQRKLYLWLAHQSLSQLEQGDVSMKEIIWQCRNRFVFTNDSEDADMLATEFASLKYDPKWLKEELKTFRQKKVGQHIEYMRTIGHTDTSSWANDENWSQNDSSSSSTSRSGDNESETTGHASGQGRGGSKKEAHSSARNETVSETLVDDLEDFYEISSRTYYTFDEQMRMWARKVREMPTGKAIAKLRNDPNLYRLNVQMLDFPMTRSIEEAKQQLLEQNFKQDFFLPRNIVEGSWQEAVKKLGSQGVTTMIPSSIRIEIDEATSNDDLFR